MKQSNMTLSMPISGPDSTGDDIDIYLQPIIELNELWNVDVDMMCLLTLIFNSMQQYQ